jgi:hypothetical protein
MEFPDYLQTIGEVGIGLAGFSGLILALRKSVGPLTDVHKYRLQVLFSLSFGAIFLSFLPELLFTFGVKHDLVWKVASAGVLLYSLLFLVWWFSRTARIKKASPEIFAWTVFRLMVSVHIIVMLILLAHILSVFDIAGAAAFSLALIWYLLHSAHQFVRMLFVQPKRGAQTSEDILD